jgi:hypothetical protein
LSIRTLCGVVGVAGMAVASALTCTPTALADDIPGASEFCSYMREVAHRPVPNCKLSSVATFSSVCLKFADGESWRTVLDDQVAMGDYDTAVAAISGAVTYLCPSLAYRLPSGGPD